MAETKRNMRGRIGELQCAAVIAIAGICLGLLTAVPEALSQSQNQTQAAGSTASPPGTATGTPAVPRVAGCLKSNPFDMSSVESVTKEIIKAGYVQVRGLYKGCDDLWRGHAMRNGIDVSVMVTPTGRVLRPGF